MTDIFCGLQHELCGGFFGTDHRDVWQTGRPDDEGAKGNGII